MKYKFCPECGFKFDQEYRFCPECGYKLDDDLKSDQIVKFENNNLESVFDEQLDNEIIDTESYEKELNKALILCKRKMFDQAEYIYEAILNKNYLDINGYIGLIRIKSLNYTLKDNDEVDKNIEAMFEVLSKDSIYKEDLNFINYLKDKGLYQKWYVLSGEEERDQEKEREAYRREVYKKLFNEEPLSNESLGSSTLQELTRFKKVDEYIENEKIKKAQMEALQKQKEEEEKRKLLEKLEKERLKALEKQRQEEIKLQQKKEKEEARLKAKEEKKRLEQEAKDLFKQTYQTKMMNLLKTLVKIGVRSLDRCLVPDGVKSILGYAFNTCKIDTLILPSSIINIEPYAFSGDINFLDMSAVNITNINVDAFKYAKIKHLILPSNLSGKYDISCLYDLLELETIEIKDNPDFIIENHTLVNKVKNEVVLLPPKKEIKVLDIKNFKTPISLIASKSIRNIYLEEVTLPDCIEEIKESTFFRAKNLVKVSALNLKIIKKEAFKECEKLKEINITKVNKIEDFAFGYCKELENITLPDNSYIGRSAFYECTGIKKLSIGKSSKIDDSAFYRCTNLIDLDLSSDTIIIREAFILCMSLKKIVFKENTHVSKHAFAGCRNLEEIIISKNCSLSSEVFFKSIWVLNKQSNLYCNNLKKVHIGAKVEINKDCFKFCSGISEVTIEKGAIIKENAFAGTILRFVKIPRFCIVSRKAFPKTCKVKRPLFWYF